MKRKISRRDMCALSGGAFVAGVAFSWAGPAFAQGEEAGDLSGPMVEKLAQKAYVYAYPLVKNYLSIYQFAIDKGGSQYKGPFNQVNNVARVFTPEDTGVITPNSDTPYSFLTLDLRAEPLVVTLPAVEGNRYYSLQIVDLYTNNVDYLGSRNDGNGGGSFLIAGPDWKGDVPPGITRVVRLATELGYSQFRTQLFDAADIESVKKVQAGYKAVPLSTFLGTSAPLAAASIEYPPIDEKSFDTAFWEYANFLLRFCPPLDGELELRSDFEKIGVGSGKPWPPAGMDADLFAALERGTAKGRSTIEETLGRVTSSDGLFGTPEQMAGKHLERAVGAMGGIYGNTTEETLYPSYMVDDEGASLDASLNNYTLTFADGQLPPVDAFWSVTMYDRKTQFLIENSLDRYLINSPMLESLQRNTDGSITLYLQHSSPGEDRQANWLPAPDGEMNVVMRLYLPRVDAISGEWKAPAIKRAGPVAK